MKLRYALLVAAAAAFATATHALPIQYSFSTAATPTGFVGVPPGILSGAVTGTFFYDSASPQTGTNPAIGALVYDGSFTGLAGTVAGYSFSDPSGRTSVANDTWAGSYDFLGLNADHSADNFQGFSFGAYQAYNVRMQWAESPALPPGTDFLSSTDLPGALPELTGRLFLDLKPSTGIGIPMYAYWDSLTVQAVPEPEQYALLLLGLGVLWYTQRRRLRAQKL